MVKGFVLDRVERYDALVDEGPFLLATETKLKLLLMPVDLSNRTCSLDVYEQINNSVLWEGYANNTGRLE